MKNNEDEVLALFSRLLERLQQADGDHHSSSPTTFIYVAKGAQNVGSIQNQYVENAPMKSQPNLLRGVGEELPEVLSTPEAMILWQKAQQAGYVDDHYQPLISRTQSALLADAMAERLGIKEKWKVFEALWNRKNMYKDLYYALNQKQPPYIPGIWGGKNICLGLFYLIMLIAAIFLMKTFVTIVILCNFGVEFRICIRYG